LRGQRIAKTEDLYPAGRLAAERFDLLAQLIDADVFQVAQVWRAVASIRPRRRMKHPLSPGRARPAPPRTRTSARPVPRSAASAVLATSAPTSSATASNAAAAIEAVDLEPMIIS